MTLLWLQSCNFIQILLSFCASLGGTLGLVREISFFSIPKVQTWKCPDPVFLLTLPVALCLPGFRLLPLLTTWRSHAVIFSVFAALWEVRGDNSLPFYLAYNSASAWHPSGLLQGCSLPNPVLSTLCKHTHTPSPWSRPNVGLSMVTGLL